MTGCTIPALCKLGWVQTFAHSVPSTRPHVVVFADTRESCTSLAMPGVAQIEPTDRYKVWEMLTMGKSNDKQARPEPRHKSRYAYSAHCQEPKPR